MKFSNLEDIIRYHVQLSSTPNSRGFYSVLCKVCNDHGRKGKRAGFKFEGDVVGYNCFNCGIATKYDPSTHFNISDKMKTVLKDFDIPEEDYKSLSINILKSNTYDKKQEPSSYELDVPTIKLPDSFYKLGSKPNDLWSEIATIFLQNRNFNINDYQFYLSTEKRWEGRLIIPIYKNRRLIFYQGRKLDSSIAGSKYLSPNSPKECVFYNYNEIFNYNDSVLFIVEGFFKAFPINGVAILGNKFTPQQIEILNKCKRKKIYIPDKTGNGHFSAEQALDNGWSISLPKIGDCSDIDDAIRQYGLMYVLKTIINNTTEGIHAKIKLNLYCDDSKSGKIKNKKSY